MKQSQPFHRLALTLAAMAAVGGTNATLIAAERAKIAEGYVSRGKGGHHPSRHSGTAAFRRAAAAKRRRKSNGLRG